MLALNRLYVCLFTARVVSSQYLTDLQLKYPASNWLSKIDFSNSKVSSILMICWHLKTFEREREKEKERGREKKWNKHIPSSYSHIGLHSIYRTRIEDRMQQHCQVVRSGANSNLLFTQLTSAQSTFSASLFLQSHPDISCLHV